jgi:hypothetical protein
MIQLPSCFQTLLFWYASDIFVFVLLRRFYCNMLSTPLLIRVFKEREITFFLNAKLRQGIGLFFLSTISG